MTTEERLATVGSGPDKCTAYRRDGQVCGQPACVDDPQRGGRVCLEHAPGPDWDDVRRVLAIFGWWSKRFTDAEIAERTDLSAERALAAANRATGAGLLCRQWFRT